MSGWSPIEAFRAWRFRRGIASLEITDDEQAAIDQALARAREALATPEAREFLRDVEFESGGEPARDGQIGMGYFVYKGRTIPLENPLGGATDD